jgi:hypothetical protein
MHNHKLTQDIDGSDLLQMSTEFNVHISLVSEPLSLKIEGLRGSLKLLAEKISNLKKVSSNFSDNVFI